MCDYNMPKTHGGSRTERIMTACRNTSRGEPHTAIKSRYSPQQPHILQQAVSVAGNENNIKQAENIGQPMLTINPDILTSDEINLEKEINVDTNDMSIAQVQHVNENSNLNKETMIITINPDILISEINYDSNPNYIISDEEGSNSHDEVNIQTTKVEENSNSKPFSSKNVKNRKINKNSGKEYVTAKGEVKLARQMKPLRQNCRNKCIDKLPENIRSSIFDEYWGLGIHDRRVAFIASLVDVEETKVTRNKRNNDRPTKNRLYSYVYHFNVNGNRKVVCKTCFLNTLGETEKFLNCSVSNKLTSNSGVTRPDQRGTHTPIHKTSQTKLDEVVKHIASFPAYKSNYSGRHADKKYLSENLNITKMYSLYCKDYDGPVSIKVYSRKFHEMGLKFRKPTPKKKSC